MKMTWLGHSGFRIETASKVLLMKQMPIQHLYLIRRLPIRKICLNLLHTICPS